MCVCVFEYTFLLYDYVFPMETPMEKGAGCTGTYIRHST